MNEVERPSGTHLIHMSKTDSKGRLDNVVRKFESINIPSRNRGKKWKEKPKTTNDEREAKRRRERRGELVAGRTSVLDPQENPEREFVDNI